MGAVPKQKKVQFEDYEIDLADYVRVLLKGKWLILGVTVIAVVAAVGLSLTMPKVYRVETTLELGRFGRGQTEPKASNLVEEPLQLVEKINGGIYDVSVKEALGIAEKDFPELKAENPKNTYLVEVAVESRNAQQAKDILDKVNELVLAEHREEVDAKEALLEEDISRLETKIASVEEEKNNLEAQVAGLQAVAAYNPALEIKNALWDAKSDLESKKQEIENLYSRIISLRNSLEEIEPTKVVRNPVVPTEPVSPKPLLNGAIAAVLGLFLGTFLAFAREWWVANF